MWAETYLIIIGNSNVTFPVSDKDVFEKPFLKYEEKAFSDDLYVAAVSCILV